jgi:hypothetical protein
MASTPKPFRKAIKKVEHYQRKHGEHAPMEMTRENFHSKAHPGEKVSASLIKKGIKAQSKHPKMDRKAQREKANMHMKEHMR